VTVIKLFNINDLRW